jgi:hypothetical protein
MVRGGKQGQLRLSPVSLDCGSGVAVVRPSGGLPVERPHLLAF